MTDLATALGWYSVPVPHGALDSVAELLARTPMVPAQAQWIESLRVPVLMDTAKARTELGWHPRHDALETLEETISVARAGSDLTPAAIAGWGDSASASSCEITWITALISARWVNACG